MKRRSAAALLTALTVAGCGGSPTESVAPTAETIAFLRVDPSALRGCVDVEQIVIDGAAAMIAGSEDAAVGSAAQSGLRRCGEVTALIDVAGRPPEQQARANVCRRAFAAKVDAYTALNRALASDGDFMAAQQGLRAFLSGMRTSTPLMRDCNTPR